MPKWALRVKTWEIDRNGNATLVLEHIFYGRTQQEAEGYATSHAKTDSFFRGCTTENRWDGVTCYSRAEWQQL